MHNPTHSLNTHFKNFAALSMVLALMGVTGNTRAEEKKATSTANESAQDVTTRAAKKKDKAPTLSPASTDTSAKPLASETRAMPLLPAVPSEERGAANSIVAGEILVHQIQLKGQSVFTPTELAAWLAPYQNRRVSSDELQQLRFDLSARYVDRGYVNSGVIIPDQKVENGVIVLQAIEGKLNQVEVIGNKNLSKAFIEQNIRQDDNAPLNVLSLRGNLRAIEQNPLIATVRAELVPTRQFGESRLIINVQERRPYKISLNIDNYRSANTGNEQAHLRGQYYNLTGLNDELNLDVGATSGAREYFFGYSIPYARRQIQWDVYSAYSTINIVEKNFKDLNINNVVKLYGTTLRAPVFRRGNHIVSLQGGLDIKRVTSKFKEDANIFIAGLDTEGKAQVSLLTGAVSWVMSGEQQLAFAGGGFKLGTGLFNATVDDKKPDSKFFALTGQAMYLRRFDGYWGSLKTRFNGQYSFEQVTPVEKFMTGGVNTVRGYVENQASGDSGMNASVEWHIPLPKPSLVPFALQYDVYPFIDTGFAWNHAPKTSFETPARPAHRLVGTGFGFSAKIAHQLDAKIDWGYGLTEANRDPLQYKGFLMSLAYSY